MCSWSALNKTQYRLSLDTNKYCIQANAAIYSSQVAYCSLRNICSLKSVDGNDQILFGGTMVFVLPVKQHRINCLKFGEKGKVRWLQDLETGFHLLCLSIICAQMLNLLCRATSAGGMVWIGFTVVVSDPFCCHEPLSPPLRGTAAALQDTFISFSCSHFLPTSSPFLCLSWRTTSAETLEVLPLPSKTLFIVYGCAVVLPYGAVLIGYPPELEWLWHIMWRPDWSVWSL